MIQQAKATVEDLMHEPGKAELIGGRIVRLMSTGFAPNRIAARIFRSLDDYAEQWKRGYAFTDNIGYIVPALSSGRESFSPDASYFNGTPPKNEMDFVDGPPTLAIEVRSKDDKGKAALREMADKRADYFEAGTLVVWDVDPETESVHVFRASSPKTPLTFGRGQIAEAEQAIPGWTMAVDAIFKDR